MTWYRRFELVVLTFALTAVFAAISTIVLQAASPDPRLLVVNVPTTSLRSLDAPVLDGNSAREYEAWARSGKHVGAFAVADDGTWGYITGYSEIRLARDHAVALCEANTTQRCQVYATLAPEGYHDYSGLIASPSQKTELLRYMSQDQFRAFAVSPTGAWGRAWGYTSPTTAVTEAMTRCQMAQAAIARPELAQPACRIIRVAF